jgi:hypothetical protein
MLGRPLGHMQLLGDRYDPAIRCFSETNVSITSVSPSHVSDGVTQERQ